MSAFVIFGVLAALVLMEYLSVGARAEKLLFRCTADRELTEPGGTVTVTTDDLRAEAFKTALGLVEESIAATVATTSPAPKWMVFNDSQAAPYFALGGIIKKKVDGAYKWQAFILEKIKFRNPDLSVATQGETIEWQTPELEATILRSDASGHPWYRLSTELDSEEDAIAAIEAYLAVTGG